MSWTPTGSRKRLESLPPWRPPSLRQFSFCLLSVSLRYLKFIYFKLQDNCFAVLCWFLPNINIALPFFPMWSVECLPPPFFPSPHFSHLWGVRECHRPSVPPSPTRWDAQEKPSLLSGRNLWIWAWGPGRMEESCLEIRESSQQTRRQMEYY